MNYAGAMLAALILLAGCDHAQPDRNGLISAKEGQRIAALGGLEFRSGRSRAGSPPQGHWVDDYASAVLDPLEHAGLTKVADLLPSPIGGSGPPYSSAGIRGISVFSSLGYDAEKIEAVLALGRRVAVMNRVIGDRLVSVPVEGQDDIVSCEMRETRAGVRIEKHGMRAHGDDAIGIVRVWIMIGRVGRRGEGEMSVILVGGGEEDGPSNEQLSLRLSEELLEAMHAGG